MKLLDFIADHLEDWKDLLSKDPYNIEIKEDDEYYLLKYNQIKSDFSNPIVQECRGIILCKTTLLPVCRPFDKFFNRGEVNAAEIDWDSARVQEKLDGSLLKIWVYNNKFHLSTNGSIDAYQTQLPLPHEELQTFGDLFDAALKNYGILKNIDSWKENVKHCMLQNRIHTVMLEICSPYNKVVVPFSEIKVYFLGMRMDDFSESSMLTNAFPFDLPKKFSMKSFDDCVDSFENLDFKHEGYVVVDKNFHRVKIKNPAYLSIHNLRGEGVVSKKRALSLIMQNDHEEFLSYFEEYREIFNSIEVKYKKFVDRIWEDLYAVFLKSWDSRKDFALYVKDRCILPSICFFLLDKNWSIIEGNARELVNEFILNMNPEKVLYLIGEKE